MGWGHPALRSPGWRRPSRLAQNIKFVRRGGIYPARDVRAAAVRADMESAPTRGCNAAWLWFFVWPRAVPPVVGADSISARGPLRRCEVPGPPPRFPRLRRAGVHARRTLAIQNWNVCAAAGSGGMGHPALRPPGWRRPSRLAQNIKFVRRGGIYCARRRVSEANRRAAAALRPEIPPGTFAPPRGSRDDASIVPYTGLQRRRVVVSRLAVRRAAGRRGGFHIRPRDPAPPQFPGPPPRLPRLRRAGVHARRTLAISKSEHPRRRMVRRDGGIPLYGRPGGGGHPGWPKT